MEERALAKGMRLVCTFALALAVARPCLAQGLPDKAAAEALFNDARRLLDEGKIADACPKFEESHRLDPASGTALNLGDCLEKQGRTASAFTAFGEAEVIARRDGNTARAEEAARRARDLEGRLSRLSVIVPASSRSRGLTILRDGAPVAEAQWGTAVPLDGGTHVIEARAPGRTSWKVEQTIRGPGTVRVEIPLLEVAVEPKTPSLPLYRRAPAVAGFVLMGVALAGGIVTGALASVAKDKDDASKEHCLPQDQNKCYAEGVALRNESIALADTATVVGSVAGASFLLGATLFVVATTSRPATRTTHAWVVPTFSPTSAGVSMGLTW
ncbi:hypothetical protein [Polyangium jinanense]|uniref:PEGA domain-containing protein n=1 Tax=Polyangium jinanense TaxID=2829994 RepID=A0A9X3XGI1_9BACT|nr:hypothetical protein [Polyangium jinanense]MDC3961261.1 hypothetical protein [Polyangium jinanense]MDC3988960.1 hypothetical protein [Polyangium jinanense]